MEKIVKQGMLYDFYGELLTKNQREIYEDVVLNDMSFSEIAENRDISRQGVFDTVRRCEKILAEYEEKLGLVDKFYRTKTMVDEIRRLVREYKEQKDNGLIDRIEEISEEIARL